MSTNAGNEPAFPTSPPNETDDLQLIHGKPGMSLRDYFAGQALAGSRWSKWELDSELNNEVSRDCYAIADAMLKARGRAR